MPYAPYLIIYHFFGLGVEEGPFNGLATTSCLVTQDSKHDYVCVQGDLGVLEPPSKRLKLDIPPLDLLSSPLSSCTAHSDLSTPSALLPPSSAGVTTPMDAATCDWADNLLATAHRPTPCARGDPKPNSVSCLKPGTESKPSPVAFRLSNPGNLGLFSPPNRVMAGVSKVAQLSRLGGDSPSANPLVSPVTGAQGSFKQPLPQGTCAQAGDLTTAPLPLKVRAIPMQPLRPQSVPRSSSAGLQSPSYRIKAAPGAAPLLPGQGISSQPCHANFCPLLSNDMLSGTVNLVAARSGLPHSADARQHTITTGISRGIGSTRPSHSISHSLFPMPVTTASPAGTAGMLSDTGFVPQAAAPSPCMMGPIATGLSASVLSPASVQDMARSIMALPTEVVPVKPMPSSAAGFMDSATAFTEGFALTHSEPETMGDWTMGCKADLHANAFAQDAFGIIQLASGMTSGFGDDSSDQSWKIPAEMLVSDTDEFVL